MKEQKKELRKQMYNLENATVKLILNDSKHVVGICKIKLESEMKKHFVFFRHSSFILKKVIIVCFILSSNRREMKSDEVHNLLSPIQSFIK